MKYRIVDDRYLEFVDRYGKQVRIDLDAMFFLDYTKYKEEKEND